MYFFSKIWNKKLTLLQLIFLVTISLPIVFWLFELIFAAGWRLAGNIGVYKIGAIITPLCRILVLLYVLLCIRLSWRAATNQHRAVQTLVAMAPGLLLFLLIASHHAVTPLNNLKNDLLGKTFYLNGVTPEGFVALKNELENSIFTPRSIIVNSGGGNLLAGMAIGKLVTEHQLDVHINGLCNSACANFIFPSGKSKSLTSNSIVMYHGNSLQEKQQHLRQALRAVNGDAKKLPDDIDLGIIGKEVATRFHHQDERSLNTTKTSDSQNTNLAAIHQYLGFPPNLNVLESIEFQDHIELELYKTWGIDHKIGVYGQIGEYRDIYQSYQYDGFYYSLEDMERMGIKGIRIKGQKEWAPEKNPQISTYYKVDLKKTSFELTP